MKNLREKHCGERWLIVDHRWKLKATNLAPILFVLAGLALQSLTATAQTYTVLYRFMGNTALPSEPGGPLVQDGAGNLYGTTFFGGDLNCMSSGCGTLFRLSQAGRLTVFHSFSGPDGEGPTSGLVGSPQGAGYGTASTGGDLTCNSGEGCGTVYRVDSTGKLTVLHSFNGSDGNNPIAQVVRDLQGNLFGTTDIGGANNFGVVFEIDTSGKETVLYSFNGTNGSYPSAGLLEDTAGLLYGSTSRGGQFNDGVIFQLSPGSGSWTEDILHEFAGKPDDGYSPSNNLVSDAQGNLYGTTIWGGSSAALYCDFGCGTVFKLTPQSGGYKESILYSFSGESDGAFPHGLVLDPAGNLYGTTSGGGNFACDSEFGCGVVYRLTPGGTLTVLHTFSGSDGAHPASPLLLDAKTHALYGTAQSGGSTSCQGQGCGVVFKITP